MSVGLSIREFLADVPPGLQLLVVAGLSLYTAVSWACRLFPSLHWLWSHPDAHTRSHFIEYTAIPTLVFVGAAVTVWQGWGPGLPLYGSWAPSRFWGVVGTFCGGLVSALTAQYLARRTDLSDARRLTSWIPLLLTLTGIGLVLTSALIITKD